MRRGECEAGLDDGAGVAVACVGSQGSRGGSREGGGGGGGGGGIPFYKSVWRLKGPPEEPQGLNFAIIAKFMPCTSTFLHNKNEIDLNKFKKYK